MSEDNLTFLKNVTLIYYKLRNSERQLSLEKEPYNGETTVLEEDDDTSNTEVLTEFFNVLTGKWFEKLTIYGVQADEDTEKLLGAVEGRFHFKDLVYDSSADEELVLKIRDKCPDHESVLKKTSDQSMKKANWRDLPLEIQKKCIKTMPFDMKTRLRRVARSEKSMVEEMKHQFKFMRIGDDATSYWVSTLDENNEEIVCRTLKYGVRQPYAYLFFFYAFWFGDVKHLNVLGSFEDPQNLISGLGVRFKCEVFSASCESCLHNDALIHTFLENLAHSPPKIVDLVEAPERMMSRLLRDNLLLRTIINLAMEIYLSVNSAFIFNPYTIQLAIERASEIGPRTVYVAKNTQEMQLVKQANMGMFAEHFADRIIDQNENGVRITTMNPEKHLICKFFESEPAVWTHGLYEIVSSLVSNEEIEETFRWQWVSPRSNPDPNNKLIPKHLLDYQKLPPS